MKIYFYDNIAQDAILNQNNNVFAQLHRLHPHLFYLNDIYKHLSKHKTKNPKEADLFFIPLFLTGFQWMNIDPVYIIDECEYLNLGKHIIVSTGDVGQRAESRYEMTHIANPARAYDKKYKWLDNRFILLVLESLNSLLPQDIAFVPYQQEEPVKTIDTRDIELSFVGALSHLFLPEDHIRGGKMIEFRNRYNNDKDIVIGDSSTLLNTKFKSYHEVMSRSKFTLCPAGYGRWTFRFIESLLLGSIPILLSDDYVIPFADVVDWSKYCYIVPESEIFGIPNFLQNITPQEINAKQEAIARDRYIFTKAFSLNQIENKLNTYVTTNQP